MFYQKIEQEIGKRKINLNQLAKGAGIPQSGTSRWKKGTMPSCEALIKICQYLNVSADYLLDLDETPPPPTLTDEELDDLDKCEDTANSVWVPGRNIVFTSIATAYAESIGGDIIIVGWDKEEAATFPDNSKEFLESFNHMLNVGSPQNIEIKAPAIDLNKDEIVKLGDEINAPMELSYSCYSGDEKHCGVCESCMRRKRAFKLANVNDPSEYNE